MSHIEVGFTQSFIHLLHARNDYPALMKFLVYQYAAITSVLPGSAGDGIAKRFANPVELGWCLMISHCYQKMI